MFGIYFTESVIKVTASTSMRMIIPAAFNRLQFSIKRACTRAFSRPKTPQTPDSNSYSAPLYLIFSLKMRYSERLLQEISGSTVLIKRNYWRTGDAMILT